MWFIHITELLHSIILEAILGHLLIRSISALLCWLFFSTCTLSSSLKHYSINLSADDMSLGKQS